MIKKTVLLMTLGILICFLNTGALDTEALAQPLTHERGYDQPEDYPQDIPEYPRERPKRERERRRQRKYTKIKLHQYVVGIGTSTGSRKPLKKLLKNLSNSLDMPYVIVQHPDAKHQAISAKDLSGLTSMPVIDATDGTELVPNHIYVIPAGEVMTVSNKILTTVPKKKAEAVKMPIDHFFGSLATAYPSKTIGIVLSGDTSDGAEGLKQINEKDGTVFIQDAETAEYKTMPLAAVASGVPSRVLTPGKIAIELKDYGRKQIITHQKK